MQIKRTSLALITLFSVGTAFAKPNCDQIIANNAERILASPAIHAYMKIACPTQTKLDPNKALEQKWFNFLDSLDKGRSWNRETFKFDEGFAAEHFKLYQFATENNLNIKAGLMGKPIVESWEVLGQQAKQKQNQPTKADYVRFLLRNYPCSDASVTEEIIYLLSEELKQNPKLVMESIVAEQTALNASNPTTSCGQKVKADSAKDKAYYSNMVLNGISEMIWIERANIPKELVDQFAQLSKEFSNQPMLKPFQEFYEAYNSGLNLELKPH